MREDGSPSVSFLPTDPSLPICTSEEESPEQAVCTRSHLDRAAEVSACSAALQCCLSRSTATVSRQRCGQPGGARGSPNPTQGQAASQAALPVHTLCTQSPSHASCWKRQAPAVLERALFSEMQLFLQVENQIGPSAAHVSLGAEITPTY